MSEELEVPDDPFLSLLYQRQEALLTELYGTLAPTAVDPDRRIGGLIAKVDRLITLAEHNKAKLDNGSLSSRVKLPVAVTVAIITASASIIVAVVGYLANLAS